MSINHEALETAKEIGDLKLIDLVERLVAFNRELNRQLSISKKNYDHALGSYDNAVKMSDRYRHQLTFWQGKFSMVKHENNKLRKKVRDAE